MGGRPAPQRNPPPVLTVPSDEWGERGDAMRAKDAQTIEEGGVFVGKVLNRLRMELGVLGPPSGQTAQGEDAARRRAEAARRQLGASTRASDQLTRTGTLG